MKNARQSTTRMSKKRTQAYNQIKLTSKDYKVQLKYSDLYKNKKRAKTTRKGRRARTIDHGQDNITEILPVNFSKACRLHEERKIIHKASKKISRNLFEIEISEFEDKMYIAGVNSNRPKEHYLIELDIEKGKKVLQEFSEDFEKIVANLQIISRRLVLLNPKVSNEPKQDNKTNDTKEEINTQQPNVRFENLWFCDTLDLS